MTAEFPSFRAMYGHAPVAGQDYQLDGEMCQDDYEFYTGTGVFTNDFLYDLGKPGINFEAGKKVGDQIYCSAAAPGAGHSIHEIVRFDEKGNAWCKVIEDTIWVPDHWC